MKRVQIDIPPYVEKMMKEISDATTWKDKELICRAIEKMYIDFVDHERDVLRLTKVYRNIECDETGLFFHSRAPTL